MTPIPKSLAKPHPGSNEAQAHGCTCPRLDNAHGKGRYGDGDKYGWWISSDCPLHTMGDDDAK